MKIQTVVLRALADMPEVKKRFEEIYKMKQIKICGIDYTIRRVRQSVDENLADCCGYVNKPDKVIVINSELCSEEQTATLRHELLHAFFHECGLERYCNDELLIEFLEIQLPKIFALCNELKII